MKKHNRILSVALALFMAVGLLPLNAAPDALAAEDRVNLSVTPNWVNQAEQQGWA